VRGISVIFPSFSPLSPASPNTYLSSPFFFFSLSSFFFFVLLPERPTERLRVREKPSKRERFREIERE
jgi:hypothetical protein